MEKAIYFDMDGTIADFYNVKNWLQRVCNYDATPYTEAMPLFDCLQFTEVLHKAQQKGYKIGIISWLSKDSSNIKFNKEVINAKKAWLKKYLPLVEWDEIKIITHGVSKKSVVTYKNGYLFDDEQKNRENWGNGANDVDNIIETILSIIN